MGLSTWLGRAAFLVSGALLAGGVPTSEAVGAGGARAANPAPAVSPTLREWTGVTGTWTLTADSRIAVSSAELAPLGSQLAGELSAENGLQLPVIVGRARRGDLQLALGASDPDIGEQGYLLDVDRVTTVQARTAEGVFNGTRTLLQALRGTPQRRSVPRGEARDWPRYPERGQMLDVGRRFFSLDYLKSQIRQMSWYKLNTFHLHLNDWNGFRVQSLRYPGLASPQHYTQDEIRELVAYAHRYHVTIVPELDVPAHGVHLSRFDPELAFSCESLSRPTGVPWEGADQGGWTLDITKPHTRQLIQNLVDELIPLFDGPYFHIGGDEIPYDAAKAACPELVAYQQARGFAYPGDAFTEFVNVLNARVRSHGRTTQLWQWWDFGNQQTSIAPEKNIQVNDWLASGTAHADAGYPVMVTQDGIFYVSPGFGQKPGDYGYADPRELFDYPYASHANIRGYKISRWNDKTYALPQDNLDHFARRPLQVMADRTWGGPKADSLPDLIDVTDQVGEGEPGAPTALSQTGWTVSSVSSEETAAENGAAANAFDNNPYTIWHTRYTPTIAPLPAELVLDTGVSTTVAGFRYLPRQDGGVNGKIKDYEVYVATSPTGPYVKVAAGQFPKTPVEQRVGFTPTDGRYVKLRVLSEWGPQNTFAAVAEFDLIRNAPTSTP
ncbi:MAG: family 20 glycosylhydrolase [Micromonosporaceae bacterium]